MKYEWIGYLAGFLTTIAFLPQVLRVIITKKTDDISRNMYLLFITGVLLWLMYGILNQIVPIIVPNFVTLILSSIILVYKIKYSSVENS